MAISYIIIILFNHYSNGKFLGPGYPPRGCDDGSGYENGGRRVADLAFDGQLVKALEGEALFTLPPRHVLCTRHRKNYFW